MNHPRRRLPRVPILATFKTPGQVIAEVYEPDDAGELRATHAAAVDQVPPERRTSIEFSAEELRARDDSQA